MLATVSAATPCDCVVPMLSAGWGIALAVVLLAGSVVAVIRVGRAGTSDDDHDQDVADPGPVGGSRHGHGGVRPEETSRGGRPAVRDEDVAALPGGSAPRQAVHVDEVLRAGEGRLARRAP